MGLVTVITIWYLIISRAVFAALSGHYRVSWTGELWSLTPLLGEFLFVYLLTNNWLKSRSRG